MRHNFEKLISWQRTRNLVKQVYGVSNHFPEEERYGLCAQIRRAAVSIPSNIAEGCGRGTDKDMSRFLRIAVGSSCELETQLFLAFDLSFISENQFNQMRQEVIESRKLIMGLIRSLAPGRKRQA